MRAIQDLWQGRRGGRRAQPVETAGPIDQQLDAIEFWGVAEEYRVTVRDWYAGRLPALAVDGTRSVHLPHPAGAGRVLKIKGAGYAGGGVQFGVLNRSGPRFAVFDFEGRMAEDVAMGHDAAARGGASFQQAATEFRTATLLAELGYPIIPCLGYGRIAKGGRTSWFSLFDLEPGLHHDTIYPRVSREQWLTMNLDIGTLLFALASRHDLIGYCWYSAAPDGRYLIRDLHPFRSADPLNMSQLSWVMQFFFALHIRGNGTRLRALKAPDPSVPSDLHVWQYRAFCPDVTLADHDELRQALVAPYMLGPPRDFSVERLIALLRSNRITAALMDACPAKFARA